MSTVDEAAALERLLAGRNQAQFARDHGIPGGPSMVSQHIKGRRPINMEAGLAYARGLGVPLSAFSPRLAQLAERAHAAEQDIPNKDETGSVAQALSQSKHILTPRTVVWERLGVEDLSTPFQMVIPGDELVPQAYRGNVGRFRPGETPDPGGPVLLQDPAGNYYLRLYREGIAGAWEGYSERPGYKTLDSVEHGVKIIAVMVGRDWK